MALLGGLAEVTEQTQTGLVLIPFELSTSRLDDDAVRQSLGAVHRAVIDGAVVADALTDDHPAVQALRDRKIPLIRESMTQTDRYVAIDDRAAALEVGRIWPLSGTRTSPCWCPAPARQGRAFTLPTRVDSTSTPDCVCAASATVSVRTSACRWSAADATLRSPQVSPPPWCSISRTVPQRSPRTATSWRSAYSRSCADGHWSRGRTSLSPGSTTYRRQLPADSPRSGNRFGTRAG